MSYTMILIKVGVSVYCLFMYSKVRKTTFIAHEFSF